ncbi:Prolyl oligopeptidase family protein [Chitinophaga costaii]|uniref:Prolyl oligopeptidase family protein n=1 Tax=Chitinophaga costaii TaxID=1335309 RepID=A0A1C4FUS6_9BACT|nr:prolyl oligopeptidase family serine peptidase [Chitinophaga costaii]PUZ27234.1 S9 family peptidase [Chitinophaga costaii]SCC59698.1 Prolyl oligopeptidase family protein [Chitinophaga costaii]
MKQLLLAIVIGLPFFSNAQPPSKKPLDHSVYDAWQSIGAKAISNNGQWVVYTINPQEGDATLVIYDRKTGQQRYIPRASNALITWDARYVAFTIKPAFKDTRQARIKKTKAADMPKDSLGIITLGDTGMVCIPNVKSFKAPSKGSGFLAILTDYKAKTDTSKKLDSLLRNKHKKIMQDMVLDAYDDKAAEAGSENGTLLIRNLRTSQQDTLMNVQDYAFSKPGNALLIVKKGEKKDSLYSQVLLWNTAARHADTLSRNITAAKQLAFDEKGEQIAYLADRDSLKALQHFFSLYYFKKGEDSASVIVNKNTADMPAHWNVSENGNVTFSKNGQRIYFGTAPIVPPKDTTIVDFEVAKVDIWNYRDDYLQPTQLKNLSQELKRNYAAVYHLSNQSFAQLGDKTLETILLTDEGNGEYALGYTDAGQRIAAQWTGRTLKTAYLENIHNGQRKLIRKDLDGQFSYSPGGHYVIWYSLQEKNWFSYNTATGEIINMTVNIPTKVYDETDDHPDAPNDYGFAGWSEEDRYWYVYDRYDIWKVDPSGKQAPTMLTDGAGRAQQRRYRNLRLDEEERFFEPKQTLILETFDETTKENGYATVSLHAPKAPETLVLSPNTYAGLAKAKDAAVYVYLKASYVASPDIYVGKEIATATKISAINPQQAQYNWGTAELYKWTTFSGKPAEGILYKPENFDSTKHYPVIIYFYEKLSDNLYAYQPPAPTPSRLNISFFVSRGYLVFAPDITYQTGHPGQSAYDYVVSGARSLAQHSWTDSTNMAIQGQSWGGYQVAYLVTATSLFKCAWAGAPVANMTSAYGGIRWESGVNRQFQYEHGQTRIGASLWENPALYLENSPLFHLPSVTTPLMIMSNDADGAVPWYQGIELFTGLRRLGKPVWLLNYNGEAHNLVQRQNRKDIQRREQQFFDHFLKGAPAPQWLEKGVPATEKGSNWGFDEKEQ